MIKRYLLYRISDGICVNVISYDGISPYISDPGYDIEIVPAGSMASMGWKRISEGNWEEPIPTPIITNEGIL